MSALTVLKTFFSFFYHPFPLSSIWMGMHGSSMECSRIHSRVGLEFHHLLQIPSGSSPISVSCAGKLNKKINALCLFSLKVEPTESILKVWYFIPRDVCPQRCLVWLTRDNTSWTTASISHPTWIFLSKGLKRNNFSRIKLDQWGLVWKCEKCSAWKRCSVFFCVMYGNSRL